MLLHSNENPTDHRRWMIRAFAIGIGIGTTRIWLALFGIAGLDFASSFGPAFWISFSLHAVAAELWLRAFRILPSLPTSRRAPPRALAPQLPQKLPGRPNLTEGHLLLSRRGASKYYC